MKLGELKQTIRKMKGSIIVPMSLPGCDLAEVAVQKGSLLAALDALFPGGRVSQTGLTVDGEKLVETAVNDDDPFDSLPAPAPASAQVDLEDWLVGTPAVAPAGDDDDWDDDL